MVKWEHLEKLVFNIYERVNLFVKVAGSTGGEEGFSFFVPIDKEMLKLMVQSLNGNLRCEVEPVTFRIADMKVELTKFDKRQGLYFIDFEEDESVELINLTKIGDN